MTLLRVVLDVRMTLRELMRSPMTVTLVFVIPLVFFSVVAYTTGTDPITFKLPAVSDDTLVQVDQRQESLAVIAAAAVGFLTAFLSMIVMQRNVDANRRLLVCGYASAELLMAKTLVLAVTAASVAAFVGLLLRLYFVPTHWGTTIISLFCAGLVYGAYGMLVGTLARRDLEGILLVVLLANIDAGWLQNPLYYSNAPNSEFIHLLPAFFPTQAAIISAFTDHSPWRATLLSVLYAVSLIAAACLAFVWRMRLRRTRVRSQREPIRPSPAQLA